MHSLDEFFAAIARGDLVEVKQQIANGVDINQPQPERGMRYTALTRAFEFRQSKVVQTLLEANAHFLGSHVIWAVEIAVDEGCLDYLIALIEAGADINLWQDEDGPFLLNAASKGAINVVKLLVEAGANVNEVNQRGEYALAEAARFGHRDIYEYLLPLTSTELCTTADYIMKQSQRLKD